MLGLLDRFLRIIDFLVRAFIVVMAVEIIFLVPVVWSVERSQKGAEEGAAGREERWYSDLGSKIEMLERIFSPGPQ